MYTIERKINGKTVEIKLTEEEIFNIHQFYVMRCMVRLMNEEFVIPESTTAVEMAEDAFAIHCNDDTLTLSECIVRALDDYYYEHCDESDVEFDG